MPVHHRLRFLTFPMRTSRLCSPWPDMRSLRFRRVPFGRDVAFDPGGATASRVAMPHILPSTVPNVSASATFFLSWLNPPPHPITVYASHPPSPTTAQHSFPGGALLPYRRRSFTGRNASASPDAPEQNSWISAAFGGWGTTNTEGRLLRRRTTAIDVHLCSPCPAQNGILPGGGPPALKTSRAETLSAFKRLDRPPKPTFSRDSLTAPSSRHS